MCEYSHTHKMSFFTLTPGRSLFCTWTSQNGFFLFVYENRTMGRDIIYISFYQGKREGITSCRHILLILQWSYQIEYESHYLGFAFGQEIEKEEQELRWKFFCRGHVWHPPKSFLRLRTTSPQLSL